MYVDTYIYIIEVDYDTYLHQVVSDPVQDRVVPDDVRLDGMHHYSRCVAKIAKCKTNRGSKTK